MRTTLPIIVAIISFFVIFTGCQKEISYSTTGIVKDSTINYKVDDALQVIASVNGVVLDENNLPSPGATVRCGNQTMVTNSMGIFFFKNVSVSKNNGSITISKNGYFKGTRNFLAVQGKLHFLRIQLIKHTLTATLPSSSGGTVDLGNGASIVFPANAFSYSNGNPYNGNVQVYAKYINPGNPSLHLTIPGDLRGIRKNGLETVLSTYGIIGADLLDANGNTLVIATGKKATLEFPIPASVLPAAQDTIALWHFDETKVRWLEEGTAIKSAGKIKTDVTKFSFWAINEAAGFVRMSCVIMNSIDSTPVGNQLVRLTVQGTSITCFGYTACTGFVMSGVPVGQPIVMNIEVSNACGAVLHTRNIGPFTTATSLDTIWIVAPTTTYTLFTGYIKNCQGNVASNSYISLYSPSSGSYIFVPDSATGYFTLPVYTCQNTTLNYSYQVTEFGTGQQSPVVTGSTTLRRVNLGNVFACTTQPVTTNVYVFGNETSPGPNSIIKYWKNGVATNVSDGSRDCFISHAFISANNDMYIAGQEWDAAGFTSNAKLWKNGIQTDITGLSFLSSNATDVFVNGTDVYVSYDLDDIATGYSSARLWKNGTSTTLSNGAANFHATCVYVSGSDVYVGGTSTPTASTVSRAIIWKNGIAQYLNNGLNNSIVRKILVSGTDVYAVGQDNVGGIGTGRAVVWKNGVPVYLTDGLTSDAMANDIFIDGTDIYVCGRKSSGGSGEIAQLWKNGVATILSVSGSNGIAQSVYVKNADVYVAEAGFINGPVRLWKNNIPTLLTTGSNFNSVGSVIVR
ncbi:MAG: hypothetical protein ABIY51_07520 [Ferruginibacter sp.]